MSALNNKQTIQLKPDFSLDVSLAGHGKSLYAKYFFKENHVFERKVLIEKYKKKVVTLSYFDAIFQQTMEDLQIRYIID